MRFEIRRKEFPFGDAPALDGVRAGYIAYAALEDAEPFEISRHTTALDAAIAAAHACYALNQTRGGHSAWVGGFWDGRRPSGVMKRLMPVSSRARTASPA